MTTVGEGQTNREALLLMTLERLLGLETTTVKDTLNQVAELITEAIPTEKVDIFLYDPTIDTLLAVGTSKTALADRQRALGLDKLAVSNGGIEVDVFQTGESFLTGRADQEPRILPGIKDVLGVRWMIAAPLDVGGERRGLVTISSTQPDLYTLSELGFTQAAARWAGMVTHRAELVERVAQSAATAARQMAAEELISVLAHDLGNLLTPLVGRVYMLQQTAQRDNRPIDLANAQAVAHGLERLRRLLDDLLDAGRLEQGLFGLTYQSFDLATLVRDTAALLAPSETAIELRVLDQLIIEADANRLRQALENLITNALKYTPQGVPIVIEVNNETRADASWAVVTVRDSGPGIPPDLMPQLFNRFVRGSGSRGLGLGLYLAHSIAHAHGGTLTVQSTPGAGATFDLAVPVAPTAT